MIYTPIAHIPVSYSTSRRGWDRTVWETIRIEPVTQPEMDRLLEKIWRAKVWIRSDPFRHATRCRLKAHLKRTGTVVKIRE